MSALSPLTFEHYLVFCLCVSAPRAQPEPAAGMLPAAAVWILLIGFCSPRDCRDNFMHGTWDISWKICDEKRGQRVFWCLPDTIFLWAGLCGLSWNVISLFNGCESLFEMSVNYVYIFGFLVSHLPTNRCCRQASCASELSPWLLF